MARKPPVLNPDGSIRKKKGKVFVEEKSDLLSLMTGITDAKAATMQAKVDKTRARPDVGPASGSASSASASRSGGAKMTGTGQDKGKGQSKGRAGAQGGAVPDASKVKTGDKRKAEKEKALESAKKAILEREREKKLRKKARRNGASSDSSPAVSSIPATDSIAKPKKRVGFA